MVNAAFFFEFNILGFQGCGKFPDRNQRFYLKGNIYGFVISGVPYSQLDSGGSGHQKEQKKIENNKRQHIP